ncbi:MAG: hypothetical protein ACR2RF_08825 [Geminicoccaceae bacterium]
MTERARHGWSWWRDGGAREADAAEPNETDASVKAPIVLLEASALRSRYQVSASPSFMFISLFGMTSEAIAERAELVDEEFRQKGLIPIYLVDEAEFSPLRAEQRLFEYLPTLWRGTRQSPDLDWPFYLRRRYLLLQTKWQPVGRIDFGDIPDWLPVA